MTLQEAINYFGTQAALAKAIGRGPAAITNWKARGGAIPQDVQFRIQVITKGKLKADPASGQPAA
jgi:hypothetical protein